MAEPITLNEYGLAVWRHKHNKTLFVQRTYYWQDRVIVLDEANGRRRIIDDTQFSTFDFSDWIPVTKDEFKKVKSYYTDIYA